MMRANALVKATAALIAVRWLVFLVLFIRDSGTWWSALERFVAEVALYTGEALIVLVVLELLWSLGRAGRWISGLLAVALLPLMLFLSISDPILFSIIGDRLSPSVLRQFVGWRLFVDSDFWQPVIAYWLPVTLGVAALTSYLACVAWMLWRDLRRSHERRLKPIGILAVAGLVMIIGAKALYAYPLAEPIEVLFLREATGWSGNQVSAAEEAVRVKMLRQFLGLPNAAHWVSKKYPLVYAFDNAGRPGSENASRPDIFIIIVESLRGANLPFVNPRGTGLADVPNLSKLARHGVVFPRFLSNGFPSGPGYISISYSAWPHIRRRIVTEFKHTPLDGIPLRLSSLGYETLHVEMAPNFDMASRWVKVYDHSISMIGSHLPGNDANLLKMATDWIKERDKRGGKKPLFTLYLTMHPHLPYPTPDPVTQKMEWGPSLSVNYRSSLHYVDAQVGKLIDFIRSRHNGDRAIIMLLGDHANFLDQEKTQGEPVNNTVWTTLIVSGPPDLIGQPRTDWRLASQVDLMPTISGLIGDRRPSAALGRALFTPGARPSSGIISVRSGGIRYEREHGGIFVNPLDPSYSRPSGGIPSTANMPKQPEEETAPDMAPLQVFQMVSEWSALLEESRVWNSDFLSSSPGAGTPHLVRR